MYASTCSAYKNLFTDFNLAASAFFFMLVPLPTPCLEQNVVRGKSFVRAKVFCDVYLKASVRCQYLLYGFSLVINNDLLSLLPSFPVPRRPNRSCRDQGKQKLDDTNWLIILVNYVVYAMHVCSTVPMAGLLNIFQSVIRQTPCLECRWN